MKPDNIFKLHCDKDFNTCNCIVCIYKKCESLEAKLAIARDMLEEIELGNGPYSQNQLIHASNCIENMKSLARKALEQIK